MMQDKKLSLVSFAEHYCNTYKIVFYSEVLSLLFGTCFGKIIISIEKIVKARVGNMIDAIIQNLDLGEVKVN